MSEMTELQKNASVDRDAAAQGRPAKPARGVHRASALLFLAMLLSGVSVAFVTLARLEPPTEADLLRGEWSSQLQATFESTLPFREYALHGWSALRYLLFSEGAPGVEVGSAGWLFTTEELELHRDDPAAVEESLGLVEEVAALLAERDALLAIALVPAKARVYEDKLPGYPYPPELAERYGEAINRLHALENVVAPDLAAAMARFRTAGSEQPESLYLRTDTHWTPAGARLAAVAVAAAVEPLLIERGIPRSRFATEQRDAEEHEGDLLRYLPVGPLANSLGLRGESVRVYETVALSGSGGLFDEPEIPAALVGTSYSAGELWNFGGFLKEALSVDFLITAEEGQGPFEPMLDYLESETIEDQPPRLVVWEIPERYLGAVRAQRGE